VNVQEKLIAEAAVTELPCATYNEIYIRISTTTGIAGEAVKEVVERLSADGVLRQRGGPPHNIAAGELTRDPAEAWFEKGEMFPFDQHADIGEYHLEIRFSRDHWEWHVIRPKDREEIGAGTAQSLEDAKAAAEREAGAKTNQWRKIG